MKKNHFIFFSILTLTINLFAQTKLINYTNYDYITGISIKDSTIWISSTGGILVRDLNGNILNQFNNTKHFSRNGAGKVIVDKDNNSWFRTSDSLHKFNNNSWIDYSPETISTSLKYYPILEDKKGNIWIDNLTMISKFDGTEWTNYSRTNSGFKGGYVTTIHEDNLGNIWFGTTDLGIYKFDGTNWTHYNISNSEIAENNIISITSDPLGVIWIATPNNRISKFDGLNWTIIKNLNSQLPSRNIRDIASDSKGNLWIAIFGSGISKYDGEIVTNYNQYNSEFIGQYFNKVVVDKYDNIWCSTYSNYEPEGLFKFDGATWQNFKSYDSGLSYNNISSIAIDNSDTIWIATRGGGISKYKDSTWTHFLRGKSVDVNDVDIDSYQNKWFTGDQEIIKIKGDSILRLNASNSSVISGHNYRQSTTDNFGNIWMMNGIGLFKVNKGIGYDKYRGHFLYDVKHTIKADNLGDIWFGTNQGYVVKFNGISSTYFDVNTIGLISDYIFTIEVNDKNEVWISGSRGTIVIYNGNSWTNFDITNSGVADINNLAIRDIEFDNYGNIWFGTNFGLLKFNESNWDLINSKNSDLLTNNIKSIETDSKGNVWIGTDKGLSVLIQENIITNTNTLKNINHSNKNKTIIFPNPISNTSKISFINKDSHSALLSIWNSTGEYEFQKTTTNDEFIIEKKEFSSSGIYFFTINIEHSVLSGKLIIE